MCSFKTFRVGKVKGSVANVMGGPKYVSTILIKGQHDKSSKTEKTQAGIGLSSLPDNSLDPSY